MLPSTLLVSGAIDLTSAVGETKPGKRNQEGKKKSKHHVDVRCTVHAAIHCCNSTNGLSFQVALEVAQKSTASMGKFDKQRAREPEMKAERKPRVRLLPLALCCTFLDRALVHQRDAELERSVEAEKKQSLAVLNRILGKAAEAEKFNVEKEMGIRQVCSSCCLLAARAARYVSRRSHRSCRCSKRLSLARPRRPRRLPLRPRRLAVRPRDRPRDPRRAARAALRAKAARASGDVVG